MSKIPFEDIRIPAEEWPEKKQQFPFKRLPVLDVDGVQLCETFAIYRYLGELTELTPKNYISEAISDSVLHYLSEILDIMLPWILAAPEQKSLVWNPCWEALCKKLQILCDYIRPHMVNGYVVDGKLSVADIAIFTIIKVFEYSSEVTKEIKTKFQEISQVQKTVLSYL